MGCYLEMQMAISSLKTKEVVITKLPYSNKHEQPSTIKVKAGHCFTPLQRKNDIEDFIIAVVDDFNKKGW